MGDVTATIDFARLIYAGNRCAQFNIVDYRPVTELQTGVILKGA
jgi:hypothetical protein